MKKVMFALACVLAATVAAQSAYAQFITPAEREAMAYNYRAWKNAKAQEVQTADKKVAQEQKTAPEAKAQQKLEPLPSAEYYLPGREMKIVYSAEYGGEMICHAAKCCWNGLKKLCKTMVENNSKYGPGGPEMAKVNAGVFMFEQLKKRNTPKTQEDTLLRSMQDSITREAQKAALRQANQAAQEEAKK